MLELQHLSFRVDAEGQDKEILDDINLLIPNGKLIAITGPNGISYSRFIAGLKKQNIEVNRKMLADLAVNDAAGFAKLVEIAKQ